MRSQMIATGGRTSSGVGRQFARPVAVGAAWVLVLALLMAAGSARADAADRKAAASPPQTGAGLVPQKVLILFEEKARHIDRVAALRERIQQAGGRVRAVIGLAGVVADIERGSAARFAAKGVQTVHQGAIGPRSGDALTVATVAAWNRIQARPLPATRVRPGGPPPGAPPTDVSDPPDLPRNREELRIAESAYRRHWEALERGLPPQLQRSSGVGCGTNGAGYFDTSLYFAGDIAVGVFYVNGTSGGWTPATTASTFVDVVQSLDDFLTIQPNARIVFTYVNEVDGAGNPLPSPTNERTYVNDLRNTWCTDWAFLVSVRNGGVWPNAYLYGPSMRLDRTFGDFNYTVRHEAGHIFGAGDTYAPIAPGPRYGYLGVTQANACGAGGGFFAGAGECLDDLMAGWGPNLGYNSVVGAYTAGQLGWLASDGDGKLDVTKTKPLIDAASVVRHVNPTWSVTYSGVAFDRPVLNQLPSFYGNVGSNRVTAVQYRIRNAAWQGAAAADGVFDSVSEGFNFTTPPLPNGTYTVEIRAINTVGAVTPAPYTEQLVITSSNVTNTRPFGSLSVTPKRAKAGTLLTASGASSRDLEPGPLTYSWKWGTSPWTLFSANVNATHAFTQAGTYPVQLRVRDQGGLIHLVTSTVTVEPYDTAPAVALRVTPENRHFSPGPNYSLSLSVVGSSDAETPFSQLMVQWDIDCNGWDGPASLQKTRSVALVNSHYPKSDRRCVRVRVSDAANNATEAERHIWVVPYNHPPTASTTVTPAGSDYTLTVNATDADGSTTWDGTLEYRFDFEGDGIWDTKFTTNPSTLLLAAHRYTFVIEVRDRFHGRAMWTACSGPFPVC